MDPYYFYIISILFLYYFKLIYVFESMSITLSKAIFTQQCNWEIFKFGPKLTLILLGIHFSHRVPALHGTPLILTFRFELTIYEAFGFRLRRS